MYSSSASGKSLSLSSFDEDYPNGNNHHYKQQPLVNLIESNSKLNSDLDTARKQYKQCLDDIEATKESTDRMVQVDRVSMERQTNEAIQERTDLFDTLESIHSELIDAHAAEGRSKEARDFAADRLRTAKHISLDQTKQFMDTCKDYQSKVEKFASQAEVLGIKNLLGPLLACAAVHVHGRERATFESERLIDEAIPESPQDEWTKCFDEIVANLASLFDENFDAEKYPLALEEDEALQEALNDLDQQRRHAEAAKKELHEATEERTLAIQNVEKRQHQKASLKHQFQRLQDDVHAIQAQIAEVQNQTEESYAMASAYQKDVESRDKISDEAKKAKNPYAKSSEKQKGVTGKKRRSRAITPQPGDRSRKIDRNSSAMTKLMSTDGQKKLAQARSTHAMGSLSTLQFPHRTGRVRSSRFGASLRVLSENLSFTASFPNGSSSEEEEIDNSTSNRKKAMSEGSKEPQKNRLCASVEDDEDEEDDALLSYVAFPKSRT